MIKFSSLDKTRFLKGVVALLLGCALNYFGDWLLGVQIELTRGSGIQGFTPLWAVDVFVLPFFVGLLVSSIFGFGGKWLSHFPPLIVRSIAYYEYVHHMDSIPQGASLAPIGFWIFMVILSVEMSAAGGVMGEIMMKGTYGRSPRDKIYKASSRNNESDIEA
jgi:hypothetical protein